MRPEDIATSEKPDVQALAKRRYIGPRRKARGLLKLKPKVPKGRRR